MRRASGDTPNAYGDAKALVVPIIDVLVTDRQLHAARYRMPLAVRRSRVKTRVWQGRIIARLSIDESVRIGDARIAERAA